MVIGQVQVHNLSSNTNMFVVDRKQFSEITNVREHKHVSAV